MGINSDAGGPAPNLVEWLGMHRKAELDGLRAQHPDEAEALSSSRPMGEATDAAPTKAKLSKPKRAVLVALIARTHADISKDIGKLAAHMRRALERISRIKLFGAIVSALAGGITGVLAIANLGEPIVQAITAFLGMVAALAIVFADHFERNPAGARANNGETYGKLLELRVKVDAIAAQIERDEVMPLTDEQLVAMVADLDEAAATLTRWDKV